jgi:SP family facilitated glucose transporter-like MFS transporter 3
MGRRELYGEVPFLALSGLQKKEHSLSVAFSSFAAQLDVLETDEYLTSTTGKGLNPDEKEQRLSQMSLLLLGELEDDTTTVTTPLIFAVLIASLLMLNGECVQIYCSWFIANLTHKWIFSNILLAGYNISVMNAPEAFVFPGHSAEEWSLAVSAFCVGAPFGCVLAGKWADNRGRRGALLLVTWLFIIGGAIQSLAPSIYVVMIARALVGLSSGASTVLVPIYLGERE